MVCANCGAEYNIGQKFCDQCGTPIPQVKKCISCGFELPLSSKFCPECGTKQDGTSAPSNGNSLSMGDKNVVAGDVIGKKSETNISGNATIINDADETKKTARCHVCGRIVIRLDGYDCPVCGEFTCKNCYVPEMGKCTVCRDNSGNEKESAYMQALERILADDRIDMAERKELMNLQSQLGISASRAIELENIVKNNKATKKIDSEDNSLSSFDKLSLSKAENLLYEKGNADEAFSLIEPLYKKYSLNVEIFSVYINALAKKDPSKALNEIKALQADELSSNLVEIDIASKNKNYSLVEEKLNHAEKYWSNSVLLKCRKIEFYKNLCEASGDTSYIMLAKKLLESCGKGSNKLEKSYIFKADRIIKKALEENVPAVTDEICESLQLYKSVVRENEFDYKSLIGKPENELLELEASTHDPKVQYYLWYFYRTIASKKNEYIWAEKSAAQGDIDGIGALGGCYCFGRGCEADEEKGFELIKKSADAGSLCGIFHLGFCYDEGKYITQDYTKAMELYQKAAEHGYALAQNNIGVMYGSGKGVAQDYAKAVEWYKKAADQGYQGFAIAQCNLGYTYDFGDGVVQDYSKAIEWYQKAAEHGYALAQNFIGLMYDSGNGVAQDYSKAVEWYKKAADQGYALAQRNLGYMYEHGNGVAQDYSKAAEWYKKAADQGHEGAKYNLEIVKLYI